MLGMSLGEFTQKLSKLITLPLLFAGFGSDDAIINT